MINKLKEKYPEHCKGKKVPPVKEQTKNEADMEKKKLLEAKIRKQVACEEKAFRIVERLIENPISEEFLIDACKFIAPHHYDDIVEERAITKICGYPVCSKPLSNISKQKYHISTRDNKVYDITERKNFCSNQCYTASKHLCQQISTSPLWAREEENETIRISLLNSKRGLPGLEVVGPAESVHKEVQHLKRLDNIESKSKLTTLTGVKGLDEKDTAKVEYRDLGLKDRLLVLDTDLEDKISKENINKDTVSLTEGISRISLEKEKNNEGKQICQEDSDDDELQASFKDELDSKTDRNEQEKIAVQSQTEKLGTVVRGDKSSINSDTVDKMQHLMKLLDRRKILLGELAEIENVPKLKSEQKQSDLKQALNSAQNIEANHSMKFEGSDEILHKNKSNPQKPQIEEYHLETGNIDKAELKVKNKEPNSSQEVAKTESYNMQSVIQMICQSVKTWISPETINFLQKTDEQDQTGANRARADFEAMYQALCRRVDAGEFEIEDIGMETKMEGDNISHQPMPQYEMLKVEVKEYESKVRKFYAGDLFSDPIEKEDEQKTPVYLPTVDSYDQMQIRRKIVMERLQKVMSDVLSPLRLTIQDVYTEYKEVISTFRLDSKNILFKPAEWTIVNLIILRMLSRKNRKLKTAFLQPSSVTYFKILLGKLGTNLQQIDIYVDNILSNRN